VDDAPRQRLDDLRRLGESLGARLGLAPARASALASHLLWYDAAGIPRLGFATLPGYLDGIQRGAIDPAAEGRVGHEHAATAQFDGRRGVPPLILSRAAAVAGEKARDVGVGLVRVTNVGPIASAAAVAAELAIGPEAAILLGPGPSWTLALPSVEGLPVVFDPSLADAESSPAAELADFLAPWRLLAPDGGWLVVALSVAASEPLTSFHQRVASALASGADPPGLLRPDRWEARRREARERGVALAPETREALGEWAARLGVGGGTAGAVASGQRAAGS
jgi:LDH2 family malate/lactate/ureidoglycolate dehydrogenase